MSRLARARPHRPVITQAVLPSPPPTTATLSGPSSGSTGAASTNFTVSLNRAADQTYTITLAGTVGSVTFTPSSPTITVGQASVTFTATPASDGAHSISFTISPSLTLIGTPITYTSTSAALTVTTDALTDENGAVLANTAISLVYVIVSGAIIKTFTNPVTNSLGKLVLSDATFTAVPTLFVTHTTSGAQPAGAKVYTPA
jgi:plastocyanin